MCHWKSLDAIFVLEVAFLGKTNFPNVCLRSTSSLATPLDTPQPTTQLRSTPARTATASEVRPTSSIISLSQKKKKNSH